MLNGEIMLISEYIKKLEMILKDHGDLEVNKLSFGKREAVNEPVVAFKMIIVDRRKSQSFWNSYEVEATRGKKVCRI